MSEAVWGVREVAEFLSLSEAAVRDQARKGVIPGRKVAKEWKFLRSALEDWLRADDRQGMTLEEAQGIMAALQGADIGRLEVRKTKGGETVHIWFRVGEQFDHMMKPTRPGGVTHMAIKSAEVIEFQPQPQEG